MVIHRCRAIFRSGIRKSRCKSAATAITVTEQGSQVGMLIALRAVKDLLGKRGDAVLDIGAGYPLFRALREERFYFILLNQNERK